MKYDVIVSDPPWAFSDGLTMSSVKRGAESQYDVLDIAAIKNLKVIDLAADDAVLALWIPSSLLQEGMDTMKAWGFRQTQTHIWVKIKLEPFKKLKKSMFEAATAAYELIKAGVVGKHTLSKRDLALALVGRLDVLIDWNDLLAFNMGRLFRQCHEICLVGVRGKPYGFLEDKAQRSVHFDVNLKHSAKPEILQDRLELMFPKARRLEMFARRTRSKWTCVGLECPDTMGEDIRDSIDRLIKAK